MAQANPFEYDDEYSPFGATSHRYTEGSDHSPPTPEFNPFAQSGQETHPSGDDTQASSDDHQSQVKAEPGPNTDYEAQLRALEAREQALAQREHSLGQAEATGVVPASALRQPNFPPCYPLIYHSIKNDVPEESRRFAWGVFIMWICMVPRARACFAARCPRFLPMTSFI